MLSSSSILRRAPLLASSMTSRHMSSSQTFKLPDLPYDFGELEPVISAEIMQIHHQKHHAAYVANLNIAHVSFNSYLLIIYRHLSTSLLPYSHIIIFQAKLDEATHKGDVSSIIQLQQAIKFNGGGHLNHSIFWKNLAPPKKGGGVLNKGDLLSMIEAQYGNLDNLQNTLSAATVGVQGSGWGWLGTV